MSNLKFDAVREVLISLWDPLCIGDNRNLLDEYDSYIPGIIRIFEAETHLGKLEKYLADIEIRKMGLSNKSINLAEVAKKIFDVLAKK